MKLYLIFILMIFDFYSISQEYEFTFSLEDFKFDEDFYLGQDPTTVLLSNYDNGQKALQIFYSTNDHCDSIIRFHSNGQISLKAELISYRSEFDSSQNRIIYYQNFKSKTFYNNGIIKSSTYVTDSVSYVILYNNEGKAISWNYRIGKKLIHGSLLSWPDENVGLIEIVYNEKPVVVINFYKSTLKVFKVDFLNNLKQKDLIGNPEVIEYKGLYYANNIQLFDIQIPVLK